MTVKKLSIVKIGKKRHSEIKLFSVQQDRKMYEVVDTACKEYLAKHDKKEADTKEKE